MRTLREFFAGGRAVSNLGALSFKQTIFRDQTRYPHWEMDKCLEMYENRPQVNSGINQYVQFLIGQEIKATSEDARSKEFLTKWIEMRPQLKREVRFIVTSAIAAGNGYGEPTYVQLANGQAVIDMLWAVPDCSRVYYNLDVQAGEDAFWIFEVPIEVKIFPWRGVEMRPKFWRINYVRGSILFQKMVYGVPLHKEKLLHLKLGWSRDNIYGRSFLASAIDSAEIQTEILKNLAIISRSRALNIKILTIGSEQDKATPEDILRLEEDLRHRKEDEHLIMNKPIKELNLSHQGQYDKMDDVLEYMRKEVASGLVPNFLTPWNSEVNRATASEVKIPFQLQLEDHRNEVLEYFNEVIVGGLRKAYPWLAADLQIEFSHVDLTSTEERMTHASEMFVNNSITMNEYREAAGYDRVPAGDIWAYNLQSPPVDRISVKQMEPDAEQTPAEGPGAPKKTEPLPPKPDVQPESFKASYRESVERVLTKFKTEDDLSLQEVFSELFDTRKQAQKFVQKNSKIKLIKTISKEDKDQLRKLVNDTVDEGFKKNLTNDQFKQAVSALIQKYDKKGVPLYNPKDVERIARTELAAMRETIKLGQWMEEGFTKVKHNTDLSPETGELDKKLNGKVFEIEYLLKHPAERIPLHPNCRCTYTPSV